MQEEFLFSSLSQFASAVSLTLLERGNLRRGATKEDWIGRWPCLGGAFNREAEKQHTGSLCEGVLFTGTPRKVLELES